MVNDRIDFVGIGAPKSGTTWLSACLADHPEIGFAADKEVYYFADSEARTYFEAGFEYYERGPEWYHRQFPRDSGARVFGEYSVSYMYDPRSAERIAAYRPDIKLLVALRSPVEMVYSWYWFNRNGLIADLPETFEATMEIPYFRGLGHYHRALEPFFERFAREQIHVLLHDDIRADDRAALREVYSFLGVDPEFEAPSTERQVNPAKATRFPALQRTGQLVYSTLQKIPLASTVINSRPFEKVVLSLYQRVNQRPMQYPPIDEDTRRRLAGGYLRDLEQLERLIGRDLSAWKAPAI